RQTYVELFRRIADLFDLERQFSDIAFFKLGLAPDPGFWMERQSPRARSGLFGPQAVLAGIECGSGDHDIAGGLNLGSLVFAQAPDHTDRSQAEDVAAFELGTAVVYRDLLAFDGYFGGLAAAAHLRTCGHGDAQGREREDDLPESHAICAPYD